MLPLVDSNSFASLGMNHTPSHRLCGQMERPLAHSPFENAPLVSELQATPKVLVLSDNVDRLGRIVDQWCARTHGREDGWNERGARLFFAGRFAAKQRVVFGGDFPGGLDASVFPQGGSPIVQFHWASVLLVLQPPFGLLAQP